MFSAIAIIVLVPLVLIAWVALRRFRSKLEAYTSIVFVALVVGLATLTAGPMHAIAAIPIVTSLRKSWPPIRPAHATDLLTQLRRRRVAKDASTKSRSRASPPIEAALHRIGDDN